MKINEIEGEDELYMKTAGIQYDFDKTLKELELELILIRDTPQPFSGRLYNAIVAKTMNKISKFIATCERTGVSKDDPHAARAIEIYNDLNKIKKP